ncbi:hypothetical protein AAG906_011472 [Vitis piasezkii]
MASRNGPPNSKPHPATRPCLCSPTTHPGSFRCSLHRNFDRVPSRAIVRPSSRQWQLEVMAKANSVKAFLLQIIKPSSHDLQRRRNFKPKPTRFCLMNGNRDGNMEVVQKSARKIELLTYAVVDMFRENCT